MYMPTLIVKILKRPVLIHLLLPLPLPHLLHTHTHHPHAHIQKARCTGKQQQMENWPTSSYPKCWAHAAPPISLASEPSTQRLIPAFLAVQGAPLVLGLQELQVPPRQRVKELSQSQSHPRLFCLLSEGTQGPP